MTCIRNLAVIAALGCGSVKNFVVASPASVPVLAPREDVWAQHMKKLNYPSNEEVCDMITNQEEDLWPKSKASDYFVNWFQDNGGKLDDWVQQMHLNATADSDITPGDFDCSRLHSLNCQPAGDGDCQNYSPAAYQVIQTEAVNLHSILQSMDIATMKETLLNSLDVGTLVNDFVKGSNLDEKKKGISIAAVSMWLISGIFAISGIGAPIGLAIGSTALVGGLTVLTATSAVGGFAFNTFGAVLSITGAAITDGSIDVNKMESQISSVLGDFFDAMSKKNAALTAKLFGGTTDQDIDLMEFVSSIDPWYEQFEVEEEYVPIMYLFQSGWFLNQTRTEDIIEPMFEGGFKLMRAGLIGYMFNARKFYVMHYNELDQESCEKDFDEASRFVDGGCFILKIGGNCLNHDDNAPTELKRAEEKYDLNVDNFFRNVRDCDNNKELIDDKAYSMDTIGDMGNCFFPLNYLRVETPEVNWKLNRKVADTLGLRYPRYSTDKSCR